MMPTRICQVLTGLLMVVVVCGLGPSVRAQPPAGENLPQANAAQSGDISRNAEGPVGFERDILPILRRNCLACHSESSAMSDVLLDSLAAIRSANVEDRPIVVPGNAAGSRLLQVAAGTVEPRMPPEDNDVNAKPLTAAELKTLRTWISNGADEGSSDSVDHVKFQPLPSGLHPIYAATITPDGNRAAYGLANQIRVLDVGGRKEIARLTDPHLLESGLYDKPGVAHRDTIQSLAISADGRWIASGGYRSIKLWRRGAPTTVRRYGADADAGKNPLAPTALARDDDVPQPALDKMFLDREHSRFLTTSADGIARLWLSSQPAAPIRTFVHGVKINDWLVDASQRWLVTLGADAKAKIWNLESGELLHTLLGDPQNTERKAQADLSVARHTAVAAHLGEVINDNKSRLTAVQDANDAAEAARNQADADFTAAEESLSVAKARREAIQSKLAESTAAQTALQASQASLEKALKAAPNDKALKQIKQQLDSTAESLATALTRFSAELQDAEEGIAEQTKTRDEAASQLQIANTEAERTNAQQEALMIALATAHAERQAVQQALDQATQSQSDLLATIEQPAPWTLGAFAPGPDRSPPNDAEVAGGDGRSPWLALGNAAGDVFVFDLESGERVEMIAAREEQQAVSIAFQDAKTLLIADESGTATAWQINTEFELAHVLDATFPDGPIDRVTSLAFSPDGRRLASGGGQPSRGGELKLWDVEQGTLLQSFDEAHTDTVLAVAFSPDGQRLATGSADRLVKIINVSNGEIEHALEGHASHVLGVDWRFDGLQVASCGADQAAKVWNAETGEVVRSLDAVTDKQLTALRYVMLAAERGLTNDDLLLAAGDGRLLVRRAGTGQNVREVRASDDFLYSLAADRDGRIVIIGGEDGVVRIVDALEGKVLWERQLDEASVGTRN